MWTGTAKERNRGGARYAVPLLFCVMLLTGCAPHANTGAAVTSDAAVVSPPHTLAPGVVHRAIPTGDGAGVDIIDVDLAHSSARPAMVTRAISRGRGMAYTPQDWLTKTHALAAINGGYFGREDAKGDKECIGLLIHHGRLVQGAEPLYGQGSAALPKGKYVRSAFGITHAGKPVIAWVGTAMMWGEMSSIYEQPVAYKWPLLTGTAPKNPWDVRDAIGCGPTLIQYGRTVVTDRLERLASPGALPRTFVGYDGPRGHPAHFILGIASAMTYQDLAAFLKDYFPRYDHSEAEAAMCLDGGASTQLSYRAGGGAQSPRATGVTVPDAVVILPR